MDRKLPCLTRRAFVLSAAAVALGPRLPAAAQAGIHTRPIPSTGERIPAVGMGTWLTFDVGADSWLRDERAEVLRTFFDLGGAMVDSSPMYGSSQKVIGYCLESIGAPPPAVRRHQGLDGGPGAGGEPDAAFARFVGR